MKKILSYLLIAFCLSFFSGTTALAATDPVMDFDLSVDGNHNVTVKTGDVITVTLVQTCSADATVITEEDRVFFDHTFFEFVQDSNIADVDDYTTILSVDSINRHYVFFNTIEDVVYTANTPITIGTFQLEVIATSGSSEIRNTTNIANILGKSLDTTAHNLIVTVEGSTPTKLTQDMRFAFSTIEKTVGDASFVNTLTGAKTAVTYTSSDTNVATIAADGTVTIVGKGTATIAAKAAEDDTYLAAEVSYTLNVGEAATKKHTLTFNTNGGSSIASEQHNEGTAIDLTIAKYKPTKSNHSFDGWYADSSLKNKVTQITLTEDTTVYAKWTKNSTGGDTGGGGGGGGATTTKYTITFETNGGNKIDSVSQEENKTVDLSKYITEKEGYKFTGWHSDKELKNKIDSIKVTKDVTVYAGWEKNETDSPTLPDTSYVPGMLNGKEHFAYIVGYDDGNVHPNADITRAEVATIFFRLLNENVRESYLTKDNNFLDVASNAWYNTAVSTMANMGILKGYEGYFRPEDPITRAEFAAIAARFADETGDGSVEFKDITGHWAESEILQAASLGWVQGYDGYYRPDDAITRAEAITLINRVLCRVPESIDDLLPDMKVWTDNMDTSKWYYINVQEATNSHTFKTKADGIHESWGALTENPDWSKY